MKTSLNYIDSFLILFSAFLNLIALIAIVFESDSVGIVALGQFFIGAYTMLISAPVWLVKLDKNSTVYKKRLIHFFGSLIYLTFLILVLPMLEVSEFLLMILLIIIPQIFLCFYCSFYIPRNLIFKSLNAKKS